MNHKPILAITMGDPCGIGPEIIIKSLQNKLIKELCTPLIIGDRNVMERAITLCGSNLRLQEISTAQEALSVDHGVIALLAISSLDCADYIYAHPTRASGDAVYLYICVAAKLCLDGQVTAMTTAPINKEAMNLAGHHYPGHTELLAELCGTKDFVMMLAGDVLRVSLVTIHEALADIPALITAEKVLATLRITQDGVIRLSGKKHPKLAVLSLNPHCGEGGLFGNEERLAIEPALLTARAEGINAIGPLSADTLFYYAAKGEYDGVVAMYHDQGLIPLKMLHFDDGVNCTLGLPIVRTSVDHGTAYNVAGLGTASESSLVAALKMAVKLSNPL